ncbi:hypothetical protein [Butyrivibrio sp. WCD3002]|uniref:hypothetical protein n=1 Tax=Butyrivibrio sp. WCD3002 TaxID=1280676 RepID=UPI0004280733|nr:hypothetical protein [Butyrivibrio sp. WCD3002]
MKLKYYLRGMGLGVLLTAIIMGVALSGSSAKISDDEIIKRARKLGMVEAENTLSEYSESARITQEIAESVETSSDTQLDTQGEKISEEVDQGESETGESVPEMDKETQEGSNLGESSESIEAEPDIALSGDKATQEASTETVESSSDSNGLNSEASVVDNESVKTESEATDSASVENSSVEEQVPEENAVTENTETANTPDTTENTVAEQANEADTNQNQTSSGDVNYVVVVIPGGSESDTCARIIREAGIIDDGVAFNNYLVNAGLDRKIRSGTKQIPKGASFEEIARIITK